MHATVTILNTRNRKVLQMNLNCPHVRSQSGRRGARSVSPSGNMTDGLKLIRKKITKSLTMSAS